MVVPAVCNTNATALGSANRSPILGNLQLLETSTSLRSEFGYTGIGSEANGDEELRFDCMWGVS